MQKSKRLVDSIENRKKHALQELVVARNDLGLMTRYAQNAVDAWHKHEPGDDCLADAMQDLMIILEHHGGHYTKDG